MIFYVQVLPIPPFLVMFWKLRGALPLEEKLLGRHAFYLSLAQKNGDYIPDHGHMHIQSVSYKSYKIRLINRLLFLVFPVNVTIVHKRNCSPFHSGKPVFSYQGCITNRSLVSLRYGCQIWLAPTCARLCRSARHALDHGSIHSGDAKFPLIHQPRRKGWKGSSMA